ncbi:hypothetical protein D3C73_1615180 [compost metagenome]
MAMAWIGAVKLAATATWTSSAQALVKVMKVARAARANRGAHLLMKHSSMGGRESLCT